MTTPTAVVTSARLERAGRVWRVPIHVGERRAVVQDELMLGDRLHPGNLGVGALIARVEFPVDRSIRFTEHRPERVYELVLSVHCAQCGTNRAHPIIVADTGGIATADVWTFMRSCECGSTWMQDGRAVD